jgi:hypothetical protein
MNLATSARVISRTEATQMLEAIDIWLEALVLMEELLSVLDPSLVRVSATSYRRLSMSKLAVTYAAFYDLPTPKPTRKRVKGLTEAGINDRYDSTYAAFLSAYSNVVHIWTGIYEEEAKDRYADAQDELKFRNSIVRRLHGTRVISEDLSYAETLGPLSLNCHISGVREEMARAVLSTRDCQVSRGLVKYFASEITELEDNGVPAEYVAAITDGRGIRGFENSNTIVGNIIQAWAAGMPAEYAAAAFES